jgi:dipeptidyl aminopeptidase/acylaminoacyl peptidase
LAFLRGSFKPEAELLLQPLTSDATPEGPARAVATEPWFNTADAFSWLPGGDELVVADHRVSLDGSPSRPFRLPGIASTLQAGYYSTEQVSIRGTRLAFSTPERRVSLMRVPLTGGPKAGTTAFLPSTRGEEDAALAPDGRRVAFCSSRSGDKHIWVCDVDGSGCRELPLPRGSVSSCSPSWSPDGRRLAFDAFIGDAVHIYVAAPEAGTIRPLTSTRTWDARPRWSRDGRSIYFCSNRSGDYQVWKTPVDVPNADAAAVQVTRNGGTEAEESPDGYLYYTKGFSSTPWGIWRLPLEGRGAEREERFLDIGTDGTWCLGSHGIFVLDDQAGRPPTIRLFDFATRRTSQVRALPTEWEVVDYGGALAVSPDGQWAVVTVGRVVESDIMLVEGFR